MAKIFVIRSQPSEEGIETSGGFPLREEEVILQRLSNTFYRKLKNQHLLWRELYEATASLRSMRMKLIPMHSFPAVVDDRGVPHYTTRNKAETVWNRFLAATFESMCVRMLSKDLCKHYLLQLSPRFLRYLVLFGSTEMRFWSFWTSGQSVTHWLQTKFRWVLSRPKASQDISEPLEIIFNLSLMRAEVPSNWKETYVIPLHT